MDKYPTFLIFQSMSAIPRSLLMSRVFKPEPICKLLLAPRGSRAVHEAFCTKWEHSSGCNPQKNPPAELEGALASRTHRVSLLIHPLNLNSFPCPGSTSMMFVLQSGSCARCFPGGKGGKGFPGHPVWKVLTQTHPKTAQTPASLPRPCPQCQHWHLSPPEWLCGWIKTSALFRETLISWCLPSNGIFPHGWNWTCHHHHHFGARMVKNLGFDIISYLSPSSLESSMTISSLSWCTEERNPAIWTPESPEKQSPSMWWIKLFPCKWRYSPLDR